ncbi:MAG: pyridoxal-phosphate dependent enzyme [Nitrospirota bacterium]
MSEKRHIIDTVSSGILDTIGGTPLIRLTRVTENINPGIRVYAKLERFNPGGSVKDRTALQLISDAEEAGLLTEDKIILDSTSGNRGT